MINEIREKFLASTDKSQRQKIAETLFDKEKKLFEYCKFMENNPCTEICILQDGVYVTFNINDAVIKMNLDEIDIAAVPHTILLKGFYEKEEFDMVMDILSYLDKGSVVFDVGANLGWYGINAKKRYLSYQMHFFEPVPNTYQRLKKNLELNDIEDCYSNCFGLSNETKEIEFFYDVVASGASSMADLRELDTTQRIFVNMKTMDEYVEEKGIQRLDFIKCDVEGAELLVYEGGRKTIQTYKPIVFSEMLRKWSAKFDYHPNDIIDFFGALGYQCFVINNGNLQKFGSVNEDTVETNYFFLHSKKHSNIISKLVC